MGIEKIKLIMKQKGITQDELVKLSGIPKSTLSKILAGISNNPTLDNMKSIAKALSCSLDDFGDETTFSPEYNIEEQKIMQKYRLLNQEGQERLKTSLDDFLLIDKYLVHTEDKDLPAETKAAHQEIFQRRKDAEAEKQKEIDDLVAKIKAGSKGKVRLIAKGGFNTVMDPVKTPEEVAELIRKYKAGELKEEE